MGSRRALPFLAGRALLGLLGLSAALAAQVDQPPPPPPPPTKPPTNPPTDPPPPVVEGQVETPAVTAGGDHDQPALVHHCSAQVMTQPTEVPAGSAGKLFVVVALQNHAVIVSGGMLEFEYAERQGPVYLGRWHAWPARAAALYPRYRGQLVYEDTLTLEIPISVDADAEEKPYPIALKLKTELVDGRTTATLLAGEMEVAGLVRVGHSLGSAVLSGVVGSPSKTARAADADGRGVPAAAEAAFALHATSEIALPAGGSSRLRVRLAIPEELSIARDERLGVPRLVLEDAGPGLHLVLGPEPEPATVETVGGAAREIWRREYEREITLRAEEGARPVRREATLRFTYAPCDAQGIRHPPATVAAPLAIDVQAVGPSGMLATPTAPDAARAPADEPLSEDMPSARDGLEFYLLLGGGGSLLVLLVALLAMRRR
jgi:hypothetical protein